MPPGTDSKPPYPVVTPQASFPAIEEAVLRRWAEHRTFERSVEHRAAGTNEYVFYDGPPFANGLPHYGHLLTGFVKDAVPRYQTMRGRRVERRFGWDCHGLPAEVAAERELGVSGRQPVLDFGVERFNAACQALVLRYAGEWERYVTRQARWVDFANDYKTMDLPYMESVMWAFKQLHDKGLAYEGNRVLPYCWECETPLSNFETRQDDAYSDRHDPAVTILFDLDPSSAPPLADPFELTSLPFEIGEDSGKTRAEEPFPFVPTRDTSLGATPPSVRPAPPPPASPEPPAEAAHAAGPAASASVPDAPPPPPPAPAEAPPPAAAPGPPTGRALADLYYAQGHYAEALQIYDDLVTRHPFDEELKRMRRDAEARLLPAASAPAAAASDVGLERRLARIRALKQWLALVQAG